MKKTIIVLGVSAIALSGCSRIQHKLGTIFGSATPTPEATTAPVVTATATPTSTPTASVKPSAKPVMRKR